MNCAIIFSAPLGLLFSHVWMISIFISFDIATLITTWRCRLLYFYSYGRWHSWKAVYILGGIVCRVTKGKGSKVPPFVSVCVCMCSFFLVAQMFIQYNPFCVFNLCKIFFPHFQIKIYLPFQGSLLFNTTPKCIIYIYV